MSELAGTFDGLKINLRARLRLQPRAEPTSLQGERLAAQPARLKSRLSLCIHPFLEGLILGGEDLRSPGQGRHRVEAHRAGENRQHVVAQAVAGVGARGVRRVLSEPQRVCVRMVFDLGPGESQHRARQDNTAVVQRRALAQAGEPARPATAGEVEKQRFGGIAGVVTEDDHRGTVPLRHAGEEGPPQPAPGFLEGLGMARRAHPRLSAAEDNFLPAVGGKPADEVRIAVGGGPAQAVMKMSNDQVRKSGTTQEIEEHHGVDASGDTDHRRCAARQVVHACEETRQEFGRTVHAGQAALSRAAPK